MLFRQVNQDRTHRIWRVEPDLYQALLFSVMPMSMDLPPLSEETRRSQIVRSLRRLIVSGSVEEGQRLTEQDLADRLGVSRAPLREAMQELVDSGLLISRPYKGISVRTFTIQDIKELYSMRFVLEKFAFRECWDKRTAGARDDLRQRNEWLLDCHTKENDPLVGIQLELCIHSWCYEVSSNRLLQQFWHKMLPNIQLYFALNERAHQPGGLTHNPHDAYVALALGDDLDAMIDHLDAHLRQGLERTLKFIDSGSKGGGPET